ncbi:MAG: hypothetical protein EOM83_00890 [Clostridia bacterium]|nr:hypothetical protein [Clostridia bacterium]
MIRLLFLLISSIIFVSISLYSQPNDTLLLQLDKMILQKENFRNQKYHQIGQLKSQLTEARLTKDLEQEYQLCQQLFDEYGSFIYDSAFHYAMCMQELAHASGQPEKIVTARLNMSFVLLSSGMFREALDTLRSIDPGYLTNDQQVTWYNHQARANYDMAEYASDPYFTPNYTSRGNAFIRKAIAAADSATYRKWVLMALLNLNKGKIDSARFFYHKVLDQFEISTHEKAMIYASLAILDLKETDTSAAIGNLARSAMSDIRAVVTETIALRNLATLLYRQGNMLQAYNYILDANNDAGFYGARQRTFQISEVLPLIEGEKLKLTENQNQQLQLYVIFLAILAALVLASLLVIINQLVKLRKARETILQANLNLKALNETLSEANKIKEEYIAYYFNISTTYVDKLELLRDSLQRNIDNRRYENLQQAVDKLNIKKERLLLFQNFDKIFLSIFPDFVEGFNALFKPEDQVELTEDGAMNTDLRIFALIRMGITENEAIAKILNFSINTIYSYKNRIKTRSIVTNNEFEDYIMAIRSV